MLVCMCAYSVRVSVNSNIETSRRFTLSIWGWVGVRVCVRSCECVRVYVCIGACACVALCLCVYGVRMCTGVRVSQISYNDKVKV